MKKTVLITGSTGFIGRQALPFLLQKGYEVHAISSQNIIHPNSDIITHYCDLFSEESIKPLLKEIKPLYLLHFAWITTPGLCVSSPKNLLWMEASLRLVRLFIENGGKRVVVAGTCAEYESEPLCEENNNSFKASTFYGQCKRNLYLTLENFAKQMQFEFAWGYLFYLYGPYERPNRFLPSVIQGILQQKDIELTEGTQIRDFLHVRDAAAGFVELLDSSACGGFNIASGEGISIRKIVEKVAEKIGGNERIQFGARPLSPFDPPALVADMQKLRRAISWKPSLNLDEGLDEMIQWWQQPAGI
jgi:nucleoside-diphosphate-sugar epimerase